MTHCMWGMLVWKGPWGLAGGCISVLGLGGLCSTTTPSSEPQCSWEGQRYLVMDERL